MSQSFPYGCGFLEVRTVKSRKDGPRLYQILDIALQIFRETAVPSTKT
jgi:hypothetical protein